MALVLNNALAVPIGAGTPAAPTSAVARLGQQHQHAGLSYEWVALTPFGDQALGTVCFTAAQVRLPCRSYDVVFD